jgi:hypothetical protein
MCLAHFLVIFWEQYSPVQLAPPVVSTYVGIISKFIRHLNKTQKPPKEFLATAEKLRNRNNPPRHGTISAIKVP